jgi:phosphoribosyl-dephospho-CoA transferase
MTDPALNHRHLAPPRHHLVWLEASSWSQRLLHDLPPGQLAAAQQWFERGHPAVARRRQPHEAAAGVTLGIPLPPGRGRARIALRMAPGAILSMAAPPPLHDVIPSAPLPWRDPLTRLAAGAGALGVTLQVYGSLLWQHLTGEPHITAHSDIDLLLRAGHAQQLHAALMLLQTWQRDTGLRVDGELLLHDERAVAWRELLGTSPKVMLKSATAVTLVARNEVLSLLSGARP